MFRFTIAAGALALGLLTTLSAAHAQQDRENARIQFERGVGLYEAHDYQGALTAFQEAYRLAPHPTVRVNMANCYEHLDRPIEAIHHFERFLAESPNAPPQQRREVEGALERLRQQVGEVRLHVAPDGATITIDDAETRRAPVLEPVLLTAGTHSVVVTMDGYRTQRESVEVTGGSSQTVEVRLERGADEPAVASTGPADEPVEATDPATTDEPLAEPTQDEPVAEATGEGDEPIEIDEGDGGGWQFRLTVPTVIFASVAVALGAGAIVTGSLASSANSDFEDAVIRVNGASTDAERQAAREDGRSAADSANTLSIVTDVLLIGTIASAGAALFFFIVDGLNEDADSLVDNGEGVRIVATPVVSPNGGGAAVTGWF